MMIPGFPKMDSADLLSALAAGELVSFLVNLCHAEDLLSVDLAVLDEGERSRYLRFQNSGDAWAFFLGRCILRAVLEKCVLTDSVQILLGEHGKPYCPSPETPHFNLSHGGGWLLLSFCQQTPVGVDLESLNRKLPTETLVKRYFSPAEQLQTADGGREAFLRIWTRKEAQLKALGVGLSGGISKGCTPTANYQYIEFQPDPETLGVVAYAGGIRRHRIWKFPDGIP